MTRVYIAGPMTGLPDYNYPAFQDAEFALSVRGFEPLSPAMPLVDGWEYTDYLRRALALLLTADAVALLDGWWGSKGARIEAQLAADLDIPASPLDYYINDGEMP